MATLRKLGRRTDHRTAMLRNLVSSLFLNGRITTTVTRAKEAQKVAEKLITEAKKGTLAGNRAISAYLYQKEVARKLVEEIAPSFEGRNGGYTRVLKKGPRRGDGADMAVLELVTGAVAEKKAENPAAPAKEEKEESKASAASEKAEAETKENAEEDVEESKEADAKEAEKEDASTEEA